jgi:predicted alpha/beta hydrolase
MSFDSLDIGLSAQDGHSFVLSARVPLHPHASLLWLPALGVAAKHYLPFAEVLAERGVAVFVHEWRGNGTSNLRPNRHNDWDTGNC